MLPTVVGGLSVPLQIDVPATSVATINEWSTLMFVVLAGLTALFFVHDMKIIAAAKNRDRDSVSFFIFRLILSLKIDCLLIQKVEHQKRNRVVSKLIIYPNSVGIQPLLHAPKL